MFLIMALNCPILQQLNFYKVFCFALIDILLAIYQGRIKSRLFGRTLPD